MSMATVNSAAMNIGVHVYLWVIVFSGYMLRSGVTESYGNSISRFLGKLHTALPVALPGQLLCQHQKQVPVWTLLESPLPSLEWLHSRSVMDSPTTLSSTPWTPSLPTLFPQAIRVCASEGETPLCLALWAWVPGSGLRGPFPGMRSILHLWLSRWPAIPPTV